MSPLIISQLDRADPLCDGLRQQCEAQVALHRQLTEGNGSLALQGSAAALWSAGRPDAPALTAPVRLAAFRSIAKL